MDHLYIEFLSIAKAAKNRFFFSQDGLAQASKSGCLCQDAESYAWRYQRSWVKGTFIEHFHHAKRSHGFATHHEGRRDILPWDQVDQCGAHPGQGHQRLHLVPHLLPHEPQLLQQHEIIWRQFYKNKATGKTS